MNSIKRIALLFSFVVFSVQLSAHSGLFHFAKEWTMACGGLFGAGACLYSSWNKIQEMRYKNQNCYYFGEYSGDLKLFAKDSFAALGYVLLTLGSAGLAYRQTSRAWYGK